MGDGPLEKKSPGRSGGASPPLIIEMIISKNNSGKVLWVIHKNNFL